MLTFKNNNVYYSQKLKQIRLSERLSQAEMAQKIGVSQQVYSAAESGKVKKIDYRIVTYLEKLVALQEKEGKLINIEKALPDILGEHEERLIRLEGHTEVFGYAIAEIKAGEGEDIQPELERLRNRAVVVIRRRMDELQMQLF